MESEYMYHYWKNTFNRAILVGIVVDELKKWPSAKNVATFSILTELFWKGSNGEEKSLSEVHHIVVWDRLFEIADKIVKRGALILVEGFLKSRSYSIQGEQKQITEIMAEKIVVLSYNPKKEKKAKEKNIEKLDDEKSEELGTSEDIEKTADVKSDESATSEQDVKNTKKIMSLLDDELF